MQNKLSIKELKAKERDLKRKLAALQQSSSSSPSKQKTTTIPNKSKKQKITVTKTKTTNNKKEWYTDSHERSIFIRDSSLSEIKQKFKTSKPTPNDLETAVWWDKYELVKFILKTYNTKVTRDCLYWALRSKNPKILQKIAKKSTKDTRNLLSESAQLRISEVLK